MPNRKVRLGGPRVPEDIPHKSVTVIPSYLDIYIVRSLEEELRIHMYAVLWQVKFAK